MSHTTCRLCVKVSDDKIYACQHSGIMCESHGCQLKTSISCIKNNISHAKVTNPDIEYFNTLLITKIKLNIPKMKTFKKGTQLYHNMLQCKMLPLKYLWKCSKVVRTSSDSFGNDWKASQNC